MTQPLQFKAYVGPAGDFLRSPAGVIRLFLHIHEAEAAAREHNGFVLPADAPSPGGFDRTWT